MKTKTENLEINTFESKQKEIRTKIYTCKTCEDQCAGHGGGVALIDGGCLCFDGIFLECLI